MQSPLALERFAMHQTDPDGLQSWCVLDELHQSIAVSAHKQSLAAHKNGYGRKGHDAGGLTAKQQLSKTASPV